jgi:tetratricopeptide (TPR) repeat protein
MIIASFRPNFVLYSTKAIFVFARFDSTFYTMDRISRLKTFIEKYPEDMFSRHALAMELIKLERFHEAVEAMVSLLAVDENHSGTYYHLGKLYEQLGENEHALKIYEKGIIIAGKIKAENDLRELKGALSQLNDELDL